MVGVFKGLCFFFFLIEEFVKNALMIELMVEAVEGKIIYRHKKISIIIIR